MSSFIQQAFSSVWSVALIVVFFGGSIFVHELGHFLAAKRRGLHIDRFSIGFGPKIFSWVRHGVEYRVSWFPLGGYVALPQLADMRGIEGETAADLKSLPPISYADKMIVAVMGAVFNVLFAFALACVIWIFGYPTTDQDTTTTVGYVADKITLTDGTEVTSPAAAAGLQIGDRILAIDHKDVSDWSSLRQTLVAGAGRGPEGQPKAILTIERDGVTQDVEIFPRIGRDQNLRLIGIAAAEPLVVLSTYENSPAARAGLRKGDHILRVDGKKLYSRAQAQAHQEAHLAKASVYTIERNGKAFEVPLQPVEVVYTTDGQKIASIGARYETPKRIIHPGPFEQIRKQFTDIYRVLSGLLNPRSDIGVRQMNGPPAIVQVLFVTSQIDVRITIWFTILININLAVFNLLPIPVLDGGHMVFATVAKLRGRALPPSFIAASQSTFMILLFSLMIFVSYRDIGHMFRNSREEKEAEQTYIAPVFPNPEQS